MLQIIQMKTVWLILCLVASSITDDSQSDDCEDKNWHSLENTKSAEIECGPAFKNKCYCSRICYEKKHRYVVNCTNSGFEDATPLQYLLNKTEVLIFTGNNLPSLPWNVFGTEENNFLPKLNIIDMSNNKIREIKGKSYHHVKNVQRLILNYNELSVDSENDHPRVFSNFESLLELHLTDAFEDSSPSNLAETLHNIFFNSNLTQLNKLHLEQNEISEFRDPNVFCDLPNLLDLHLGDNALTALHFNLSCLHELRFLDLQRNKFTSILNRDLKTLDTFAKHNQTVMIDLLDNPLECSCKLNPFIEWMKKTKIFVRNKNNLRCKERGHEKLLHEIKNCHLGLSMSTGVRGTSVAIIILSLILVALICSLFYIQRQDLKKKLAPVIDSVSKRVRYTSIATVEARENDV